MTDRVMRFLDFHRKREYRADRREINYPEINAGKFRQNAVNFSAVVKAERPILYEDDIFGFNRSVKNVCDYNIYCDLTNFTPDYGWALSTGFDAVRAELSNRMNSSGDERREFFAAAIEHIDAVYEMVDKYRAYALEEGNIELYNALATVPRLAATDYYQALVFMKIMIYTFRASHLNHVTLGRFDQYMYPYFLQSQKNGMTKEQLTELTELFFISINLDTDLYNGVQQGDNGQSMVLGGCTADREDVYNRLSDIIMDSSLELCLIDPKINLRVNKNTPRERFVKGTCLTQKGLGFPQYCNDDVVIPGLVKLGYSYEDACEYAVAACWEFIIPAESYEISNIVTMNFPLAVRRATICSLPASDNFEQFMVSVKQSIFDFFETLKDEAAAKRVEYMKSPNPFASLFIRGCRQKNLDITELGAKYNNDGVHGLGIAPAADALAAIKKTVFDEKSVDKTQLVQALECNFEGCDELRSRLLNCPKMGNNDKYVDEICDEMLDFYAGIVDNVPNSAGGVFRAGTGGSMDYIYMSENVGATADGRLAGQPYPSSFSPSIGVKTDGPLSVIKSFTRFDMTRIINGGPLTIELHANVFRNRMGVEKVADLVRVFVFLGGHQLQLNSVSREKLLDAQAHPEKYPDLIVRVWGWSGYFNELDLAFQNHIIARTEYNI